MTRARFIEPEYDEVCAGCGEYAAYCECEGAA
jgi:hypothetical protein